MGEYQINLNVSREEARKFLFRLASEEELRNKFDGQRRDDALAALAAELEIDVKGDFPETVKLPPKKEIMHLLYAADSALDQTASPFGLLVVFVFGAMPVTAGRTPGGDAAG